MKIERAIEIIRDFQSKSDYDLRAQEEKTKFIAYHILLFDKEIEEMPTEELEGLVKQTMQTPTMKMLTESFTPRLYLTFTQRIEEAAVDAGNAAAPIITTLGPYIDAEISSGEVYVTTPDDEDDDCNSVVVATFDDEGYMEVAGLDGIHGWLKIRTVPPQSVQ